MRNKPLDQEVIKILSRQQLESCKEWIAYGVAPEEEEVYSESMAIAIILTLRQRGYEIVHEQ